MENSSQTDADKLDTGEDWNGSTYTRSRSATDGDKANSSGVGSIVTHPDHAAKCAGSTPAAPTRSPSRGIRAAVRSAWLTDGLAGSDTCGGRGKSGSGTSGRNVGCPRLGFQFRWRNFRSHKARAAVSGGIVRPNGFGDFKRWGMHRCRYFSFLLLQWRGTGVGAWQSGLGQRTDRIAATNSGCRSWFRSFV